VLCAGVKLFYPGLKTAYSSTSPDSANGLLRVIADRMENGEAVPEMDDVFSVTAIN
jgi:hypothetical protein